MDTNDGVGREPQADPPAEGESQHDHEIQHDTRFFGHPWGLANVFGVEMWERFSFYGMQSVVIFYMYFAIKDGGLGIPEATATSIMGAYGGTVYLCTVVGAWLADRILGSERVLFYSAWVIMLGHIALAVLPGVAGLATGLILVALGSGGLKANATAVVGTLYSPTDERRDAGFSVFYLGINLGAFAGPIISGILQDTQGFDWAFGAAAIGMAIGLIQYSIGRRNIPDVSREVSNPLPRSKYPMWIIIVLAGLALIVVLVLTGVIVETTLSTTVVVITALASIAYFVVILSNRALSKVERSRVMGFIPLFIGSVGFWTLYQQQFTVVPVYTEKQLNLDLFGWQMPANWVQSINPIFIIVLSGVFAAIWAKLGSRAPSTPMKFGIACIAMGIAFLLFLPFAGGDKDSTPLLAMVGILLVFTIAELFLSPVGLSVTTKLAPGSLRSQMVALWFLSTALGTALTGQLSPLFSEESEVPYFSIIGIGGIILGVVLIALVKPTLKLMRGVR